MEQKYLRYMGKPSEDLVRECEQLLEYYLSALGAKVTINLFDQPLDIRSSLNGVEMDAVRHWIESVTVSTPDISSLEIRLFDQDGLDENWKKNAWLEAYSIQGQIYGHLDRNPGSTESGDPYWELWKKRNDHKEN